MNNSGPPSPSKGPPIRPASASYVNAGPPVRKASVPLSASRPDIQDPWAKAGDGSGSEGEKPRPTTSLQDTPGRPAFQRAQTSYGELPSDKPAFHRAQTSYGELQAPSRMSGSDGPPPPVTRAAFTRAQTTFDPFGNPNQQGGRGLERAHSLDEMTPDPVYDPQNGNPLSQSTPHFGRGGGGRGPTGGLNRTTSAQPVQQGVPGVTVAGPPRVGGGAPAGQLPQRGGGGARGYGVPALRGPGGQMPRTQTIDGSLSPTSDQQGATSPRGRGVSVRGAPGRGAAGGLGTTGGRGGPRRTPPPNSDFYLSEENPSSSGEEHLNTLPLNDPYNIQSTNHHVHQYNQNPTDPDPLLGLGASDLLTPEQIEALLIDL